MPAFIQRNNIRSLSALIQQMFTDFKDNGFNVILPAQGSTLTVTGGVAVFVMESTAAINPLHDTQPWRIRVAITAQDQMIVVIAGRSQISDTGEVFDFPSTASSNTRANVMGLLGTAFLPQGSSSTPAGTTFIGRGVSSNESESYRENLGVTYGYTLSVTDHGVVFYSWENSTEASPKVSMFCVQSPVNKDTGAPLIDLKSPIFCVYCCDGAPYKKFIISESDVHTPTKSVPAGEDTVNSAAIINEEDQVAVKLDNQYLITFPNRVNTERFAYSEELDLIAYTSADVIGEDTVLPITVYGEQNPRLYRAMKANGPHNSKMRLLVIQQGAGIPAPVAE